MGLFGPSPEKIRRSAADAFPNVDWKMDVDWSTGAKLHQLNGTMAESRSDADTMAFARTVWASVASEYRLSPDDGRDGLLDVSISCAGCSTQRTGVDG